MTYAALRQQLEATGIPFAEGGWAVAPATDYGVYALDGEAAALWADDAFAENILEGTVDLFTRDNGGLQRQTVQQALIASGVSWRLNTIQYESDTRLTHIEWIIEVVGDHA